MKKYKTNVFNRIGAFVLALALVITLVLPNMAVTASAEETEEIVNETVTEEGEEDTTSTDDDGSDTTNTGDTSGDDGSTTDTTTDNTDNTNTTSDTTAEDGSSDTGTDNEQTNEAAVVSEEAGNEEEENTTTTIDVTLTPMTTGESSSEVQSISLDSSSDSTTSSTTFTFQVSATVADTDTTISSENLSVSLSADSITGASGSTGLSDLVSVEVDSSKKTITLTAKDNTVGTAKLDLSNLNVTYTGSSDESSDGGTDGGTESTTTYTCSVSSTAIPVTVFKTLNWSTLSGEGTITFAGQSKVYDGSTDATITADLSNVYTVVDGSTSYSTVTLTAENASTYNNSSTTADVGEYGTVQISNSTTTSITATDSSGTSKTISGGSDEDAVSWLTVTSLGESDSTQTVTLNTSNQASITARTLYVKVSTGDNGVSVPYGSTLSGYSSENEWVSAVASALNSSSSSDTTPTVTGNISAILTGDSSDGSLSSDTDSGLVNGDSWNTLSSNFTSAITYTLKSASENTYVVGTNSGVIGIAFTDSSSSSSTTDSYTAGNYTLKFDSSGGYGDLTVTAEEVSNFSNGDILTIALNSESSTGTYTDSSSSTNYILGTGTLALSVSANTSYSSYSSSGINYSSVSFTTNESSTSTTQSLSSCTSLTGWSSGSNFDISTVTGLKIRLEYSKSSSDSDSSCSVYTEWFTIPSGIVTVDNLSPTVSYDSDWTNSLPFIVQKDTTSGTWKITESSGTITVSQAGSTTTDDNEDSTTSYTDAVTITDPSTSSSSEDESSDSTTTSGSGIAEIYYAVVSTSTTSDSLSSDSTSWTCIYSTNSSVSTSGVSTDGTFTVSYGSTEGSYMLAFKVVDNVGNSYIGSHDGTSEIVVDTTAPTASFNVDSSKTWGSSITYTLTVYDQVSNSVKSDVASVAVSVYKDGSSTAETEADNNSSSCKDTWTIGDIASATSNSSITSSTDSSGVITYTISGTVTLTSDTSETWKISATVTDNAGNETTVSTSEIQADTKAPSITAAYAATEDDTYYNTTRTLNLSITERDFNASSVTIVLNIDGTSATKTLDALSDLTGISTSLSVSGSGDDKVTVYAITFGESNANHVYAFTSASMTDVAGNSGSYSENTDSFTVDMVTPTVTVSYKTKTSKTSISPGTSATLSGDSYLYLDEAVVATLTVTEDNFDNSCAAFTIKADTGSGTYETVTSYSSYASTDSSGYIKWTDNGNGTWSTTVTFSDDADYMLGISVTDLAGNTIADSDAYSSRYFTVDTTAPEIAVKYYTVDSSGNLNEDITDSVKTKASLYEDETVAAVVTITERDFGRSKSGEFADQMSLTYTAKDSSGNAVAPASDYVSAADTLSKWTSGNESNKNSTTYSQQFTFSVDANYTLKLAYTDLAGNTATTYDKHYFTVDTTAPEGEIYLSSSDTYGSGNGWSQFFNTITFGIFAKEKQTFKVSSEDATSESITVQYYKYTAKTDSSGSLTGLSTTELKNGKTSAGKSISWKTYSSSGISLAADSQAFIYVKLTDSSGNVTYINTKKGTIVDSTEPDLEITVETEKAASAVVSGAVGLYDGNVKISISMNDPVNGDTYAGLSEVYYEIRKDGTAKKTNKSDPWSWTASDRVTGITKTLTISADTFNSNDVEIYVHATDNAGNTYEATKTLSIDVTNPTIDVEWSSTDDGSNGYYNANRYADITITERNLDTSDVTIKVYDKSGNDITSSVTKGSWSSKESGKDSDTHSIRLTFSADNDYILEVQAVDQAGNEAKSYTSEQFTVDQTGPEFSISWSSTATVQNGMYYSAARTATITVTEHNFDSSAIERTITKDGASDSSISFSSWSTSGDTHTASLTFSSDANYTLALSGTDQAGNSAEMSTSETGGEFVIDTTAPTVTVSGVSSDTAYADELTPVVTISDTNYDSSGVSIELVGSGGDTVEVTRGSGSTSNSEGESIVIANFEEQLQDEDNIYTLSVTATDLAGNTNNGLSGTDSSGDSAKMDNLKFSVNRYGSTFELVESTAEFVSNYYSNQAMAVSVTEINSTQIVDHAVSYTLENQIYTLTEDEDYSVTDGQDESGWYTKTYTIYEDNFLDDAGDPVEGTYTVVVQSEDEAGHTMETENWNNGEANITFVIDTTAPSAAIEGMDEDTYDVESLDIQINVADEYPIASVALLLGTTDMSDEEWGDVEETVLEANEDGEYTYTLTASNKEQEVRVVVADAAGNVNTSVAATALITTSTMAKLRYTIQKNMLLLIILIILIIAAAVLVWYFLFKRKKDDEDGTAKPDAAAQA